MIIDYDSKKSIFYVFTFQEIETLLIDSNLNTETGINSLINKKYQITNPYYNIPLSTTVFKQYFKLKDKKINIISVNLSHGVQGEKTNVPYFVSELSYVKWCSKNYDKNYDKNKHDNLPWCTYQLSKSIKNKFKNNIDIIGIQEIEPTKTGEMTLNFLNNIYGKNNYLYSKSELKMNNVITAYKKNEWEIIYTKTINTSDVEDRPCLINIILNKKINKKIIVINIHYPHRYERKYKIFQEFLDEISTILKNELNNDFNFNIVLLGDLNQVLDNNEYKILNKNVKFIGKAPVTCCYFEPNKLNYSNRPGDYILSTNPVSNIKEINTIGSDHKPVFSSLRIL